MIYMVESNQKRKDEINQFFADQGVTLTFYETPEALEYAISQAQDISGIILPISMKPVNGLDLTYRFRKKYHLKVPIICLSRQKNEQIILACQKAGASAMMLLSPFEPVEIFAKLQSFWQSTTQKEKTTSSAGNSLQGDAMVMAQTMKSKSMGARQRGKRLDQLDLSQMAEPYQSYDKAASQLLKIAEGKVAVSFGSKNPDEKSFFQGYILGLVEDLAKYYKDGDASFIQVLSDVMLETSRFTLEEIHEMLIDWGTLSKKPFFQKGVKAGCQDVMLIIEELRTGRDPNPSGLLIFKKIYLNQQAS